MRQKRRKKKQRRDDERHKETNANGKINQTEKNEERKEDKIGTK